MAVRGLAVLALVFGMAFAACDNHAGDSTPTVTTVTVTAANNATSVAKGGTLQFSAAVAGENNPAQTVTWSIVTAGVVSGTAIDSAGLLTVATGEIKTSIEVKATSTVDSSKSGSKTVDVSGSSTVTTVTVTAADSVVKGGTLQFSAAVAGENSPAQTVTWSIVTAGVASGTAINSTTGLLTVAAGETKTSIEVKATSTVDTSKSGTKTVTVTINPPEIAGQSIYTWSSEQGFVVYSGTVSEQTVGAKMVAGENHTPISIGNIGTISADGKLTLNFPSIMEDNKLFEGTSLGMGTPSPSDTKVGILQMETSGDASLPPFNFCTSAGSPLSIMYFNKNGSLTVGDTTITWAAGWNYFINGGERVIDLSGYKWVIGNINH